MYQCFLLPPVSGISGLFSSVSRKRLVISWWSVTLSALKIMQLHYFNSCTVYLLLFCTMTNKFTNISQIITPLHVSTLLCHLQGACNQYFAKLHKYFNNCFWNACVTWQGINYKLPEDDTIVSKPVGCMIICEIIVHLLVIVQNSTTCLRLWFRACLWFCSGFTFLITITRNQRTKNNSLWHPRFLSALRLTCLNVLHYSVVSIH